MIHPSDFTDAHRRHWDDAELLYRHACWPNADQLYGFSAECGLKAMMKAQGGMPVDASGKPTTGQHLQHVDRFWSTFVSFANGLTGARYVRLLPSGTPFADWSHHNRYAHRRHSQESDVEPHREAARKVCQMVQKATQDGLPL